MPFGGVGEQARQDVAQQDQGHLLHVQTEDGVEQLHCPLRVLLPRLLQQLLDGQVRWCSGAKGPECGALTLLPFQPSSLGGHAGRALGALFHPSLRARAQELSGR